MWLYVPASAVSACAPESECLTSESGLHSSILVSTTALPVTSKGKLLQPRSLSRSWKRAAWMKRLSSLICAPSTASRGVEKWIASLPDSPVNLTLSLVSGKDSQTNVGYGLTLRESLAKYNRASSCWKTSPDLFAPEGLPLASVAWPSSGTTVNGQLWRRPMLALRTSEKDFSSWATPDANTSTYSNGMMGPNIRQQAAMWQTPSVQQFESRKQVGDSERQQLLGGQAKHWPTPDANADSYRLNGDSQQSKSLEPITRAWSTPCARIVKGGGKTMTRKDGKSRMDMLDWQAEAYSRPVQSILDGKELSPTTRILRRRLNPAFVAWLMGLPGWWTSPALTSSVRSEMESYLRAQRQHLSDLLKGP